MEKWYFMWKVNNVLGRSCGYELLVTNCHGHETSGPEAHVPYKPYWSS